MASGDSPGLRGSMASSDWLEHKVPLGTANVSVCAMFFLVFYITQALQVFLLS